MLATLMVFVFNIADGHPTFIRRRPCRSCSDGEACVACCHVRNELVSFSSSEV
jgi:hypothetical protein